MKYANDGLCWEFRQHLDMMHVARPITTLTKLDAEITNWLTNTMIDREFTKACIPTEEKLVSAGFAQAETDDEQTQGFNYNQLDAATNYHMKRIHQRVFTL
jgi:hypothetical protein